MNDTAHNRRSAMSMRAALRLDEGAMSASRASLSPPMKKEKKNRKKQHLCDISIPRLSPLLFG
jgi:hypothetical protein